MSEEASIVEPLFLNALTGSLKNIDTFLEFCLDHTISLAHQKKLLQTANQAINERPYDPNVSNVLMLIGVLYHKAEKGAQNYDKAIKSYEDAIEKGSSHAMFRRAWMHEVGQGGEINYEEAINLYEQASERGNAGAKNNLAGLYRNGHGCDIDYMKAIELYESAINEGNAEAILNRGRMYEFGEGSDIDFPRAVELYVQALQQGLKKESLERLADLANEKQENAAFHLFLYYQRAGNLLEATYWFNKNETKVLKLLSDEIIKQLDCSGTELQFLKQLFTFAEQRKTIADSATGFKIDYLKMHFLLHDGHGEEAIFIVNNILLPSHFPFSNSDLQLIANTQLKLSHSSKIPNEASAYRDQAKTNLYSAYKNNDMSARNRLLALLREDAGLPSLDYTQNESAQADETDNSLLIQFETMQEMTAQRRLLDKAAIETYLHPSSRCRKMLLFFSSLNPTKNEDSNRKACRKIIDALATQNLSDIMKRPDINNSINDPELSRIIANRLAGGQVSEVDTSHFQEIDIEEEINRFRR